MLNDHTIQLQTITASNRLNDMFAKIQVAGKEGHAQVFSRLEIVSTRFKEKVPLRCM